MIREKAIKQIQNKKLEKEPFEDMISREEAKYKYKQRLVNNLKDNSRNIDFSEYAEEPYKAFCEFIDSLPPVNPQYTGNEFFNFDAPMVKKSMEQDAVSREAVLSMQYRIDDSATLSTRDVVNVDDIESLPPVTQRSGKWILLDECANSGYYCSNCQKKLVKEGWSNTVKKINYCPNCGAKMESEDKEC